MLQSIHKKRSFKFGLILLIWCFLIPEAHAASLSISPASSKVSAGNIISVKVLVDTEGKAINSADSVIQFPSDLLEVMSVNKASSIFSLWVEDPKFSNYDGTVAFEGGLPTPGFVGHAGEVITVTFRAKKQGAASIVFSDSAVRQNDGLGTDILSSKQPAGIQISASSQVEIPTINTASNSLPAKPLVTSSTHPHQDTWYSGTTASFSWTVPNDVTSIQTLLNKNINAIPTVTYDGSVSQRTVNNLTDGVLYFNVRYLNNVGWGPIAHYKVQIDSTPPEKFTVRVREQNSQDIVALNASDAMSGIDSYSLKIDDGAVIHVKQESLIANEYVLPTQNQGDHSLSVIAYDKAGNHTASDALFISPEIVPPTIVVSPDHIKRGEVFEVSGKTSYPHTAVNIFAQTEGSELKIYSTKTTDDGSYAITSDETKKSGQTEVWSQLVFSDSVKSPISEKATLQITDTFIVKTSKSLIYGLSYIIPMILLLLALIFMLYLGWHKFFGLKRKLSKEMQSTAGDIHKSLMQFKGELNSQLSKLEKTKEDRDLNKKEEKIFKELQENIDSIDAFVEKKLKKII